MILTRKSIFLPAACLIFSACVFKKKPEADGSTGNKTAMLNADRAFSQMSAEKGMKNAFLEYIDSNGVLLRHDVLPIAGADAVDYLIAINDSDFTMTWKPINAEIAGSGELGYTYGTYSLVPKKQDTILYGTYVSIWKKNAAGKWKFILDSGNEGIGDAEVSQ